MAALVYTCLSLLGTCARWLRSGRRISSWRGKQRLGGRAIGLVKACHRADPHEWNHEERDARREWKQGEVPRRAYCSQWPCINSHLHKTFICAARACSHQQIEDITPNRQPPPPTSRPYYQPHIQFCFLPFGSIGVVNPSAALAGDAVFTPVRREVGPRPEQPEGPARPLQVWSESGLAAKEAGVTP